MPTRNRPTYVFKKWNPPPFYGLSFFHSILTQPVSWTRQNHLRVGALWLKLEDSWRTRLGSSWSAWWYNPGFSKAPPIFFRISGVKASCRWAIRSASEFTVSCAKILNICINIGQLRGSPSKFGTFIRGGLTLDLVVDACWVPRWLIQSSGV